MCPDLTEEDEVLCLISGGGSALLSLPLDGISLEGQAGREQGPSGLRCHDHGNELFYGAISPPSRADGWAAACHPANLSTLLISDVPGDNPIDIASGPTVGDPTCVEDALEIVRRYKLDLPDAVMAALKKAPGRECEA